ncbi:MAG: hypothetical protein E6Q74_05265 [Pseudoxanthomonas sp.]|nr:MAG: hypothetical protein E6Q74_05265 [Pseudoxanthomonas sp.]
MTILAGDIKLIASQVMDDVPEGGGAPTPTVIADAVSNAIFTDISELDRAGGRVSMRKVFVGVDTDNRDGYFGANVIVADPPDDPLVSVSVFSTRDVFDRRSVASARVESYLNAGPEWPGYLYENHIAGQRAIQIFQRTNVAPPPIGRTLVLRMNEGLSTEFEQYVRITRVQSEERTFTDPVSGQDYQALVVTLDISDALREDYDGSPASKFFTKAVGKALIRDTVVADAGNYHGAQPITVAVEVGDTEVQAASAYTQLVPNARTESAVLDQKPTADYLVAIATTPKEVLVGGAPLAQRIRVGQENRAFNYVSILTPLPAPGSLRVTFRALGTNYTILDNGDGTLGGSGAPGSGVVNYTTGSVSVTLGALPDDRSAVVIYWGQNTSYTNRSGQAGFRPPEYAFNLEHTGVEPSSVTLTWTSAAVVRTATDNGSGKFTGDGVGDINYATGEIFFRPSHMLDPGGEIEIDYEWAAVVEEAHPGLSPDGSGIVNFTLAQTPVPGSLNIVWATTRETAATEGASLSSSNTAKDSGSSSTQVDYTYPMGLFGPTGVALTAIGRKTLTSNRSSSSSSTYSRTTAQVSKNNVTVYHQLSDDAAGSFVNAMGTVGYVSKAVAVKVRADYSENSYQSNYEDGRSWDTMLETADSNPGAGIPNATTGGGGSATAKGGAYATTTSTETFGANSLVVRYKTGTPTPQVESDTYTPPDVVLDLCPYTKDRIVPGSLRFIWMGTTYDDFEGKIYRGRTDTDPGIHSGDIDYEAGVATMFDYIVSGSPSAFTLVSMFTTKGDALVANMVFSTSSAPIKPSALTLSVVDATGTQLLATSDLSGNLTGPHTKGKIDYESGLVEVQFGDYVLDSTLTTEQKAEWWYDAGDVQTTGPQTGKIWRPWPVDPQTLRYNFVSYFYLPLDASILGLDPVRLPQDGRVPIFRPGGFVVLGNTQTIAPATYANGNSVNCGRVRLSRVRLIDDNGEVINTGYTANLDAGTVTINNITGWSQPVTIEHRVEDMAMVAEVQINGRLRLTRQVTHAYPTAGSYVSSALVAGDLRARVSVLFDQVTLTSTWSDSVIGDPATGTFNDIAHPIVVSNSGALTERWAIQFTNTTQFRVIGEHVGVIALGDTSSDCSPLNPASGTPYFTIPALGWGTGWAIGNVLRFNTVGAYFPVWVVRTIQQGPETVPDDSFTLLIRGDVDAP